MLLVCAACGDDSGGGQKVDTKDGGPVGDAGDLDARADGAKPDASRPEAAVPEQDAAKADAASDAASSDAQVIDAGPPPTLRSIVCGDRTSWPNPLPPVGMRDATVLKSGFGFVEGPVWFSGLGLLLFSDMDFGGGDSQGPPAQIRRLLPPTFDVFKASSGSNGLARWSEGTVLAATHDTRSLSFFDAQSGARSNIAVTYQGKKLNSPNDLTVREDGMVYFTDPNYQLGSRSSETKTAVYRVKLTRSSTTASAILIDDTLNQPNGIALSPDQKTLYVGSAGNDIFKFDVADDGSVSGKTVFASPGASDGLTVDCAGNLYVTSGTVEVFAPNGDKLGEIAVGDNPSNVAFGGDEGKTLYITAQDTLYSITLNVSGFPY